MASITAMNMVPGRDPGVRLYTVNAHVVPAINNCAYVLTSDVAAAQALGWTVVNPQPSILSGVSVPMNPPAGGLNESPSATLPDGTVLSTLVANQYRSSPSGASGATASNRFTGLCQLDREVVFNIPVQWAEYLLANGWRNAVPV